MKLSYTESLFTCLKLTKKSLENVGEIRTKLSKNLPKRGRLQDIPDLDSHSSFCREYDFSGNDAGSDVELWIFVASKHNCDRKLSKPL